MQSLKGSPLSGGRKRRTRRRRSRRNKRGRGPFSFLKKKPKPEQTDVEMPSVDPRELPRTLKETYNSRDRYASDPDLQKKYPDGLSNSAMHINKLEQQVREKHGDDKLKQIKQEYNDSVCSNEHGTYTNYGVVDCPQSAGKKRKSRKRGGRVGAKCKSYLDCDLMAGEVCEVDNNNIKICKIQSMGGSRHRKKTRKNKRRRKRGGVKESNAPDFHDTWSKDFPEQSQKDLQQQQLTHGKTNLVRGLFGFEPKKKKAALVHPIGGRKRRKTKAKKHKKTRKSRKRGKSHRRRRR